MAEYKLLANKKMDGMRLDIAFVQAGLGLSRRKIRSAIDVGGVYVNGRRVRIASRTIKSGDQLQLNFDLKRHDQMQKQSFSLTDQDIIFEDANAIAINKPPGLPSQATRDQAIQHVVPCLQEYLKKSGRSVEELILVHRLDKETSGILLLAKNKHAATWMTTQFRDRQVQKTYHAIVHGIPKQNDFTQENHLSSIHRKLGVVRVVRVGGKYAKTSFKVLATNQKMNLSLVECYPETGRSHQIRVHLEHAGFPILGDKKYGVKHQLMKSGLQDQIEHHLLHAYKTEFSPNLGSGVVTVEAEYPAGWRNVAEKGDL